MMGGSRTTSLAPLVILYLTMSILSSSSLTLLFPRIPSTLCRVTTSRITVTRRLTFLDEIRIFSL